MGGWDRGAQQATDAHVAETAMNIGYACKLLTDDMEILEEKEVR